MYGTPVTVTAQGVVDDERTMAMALFVAPCLALFVRPAMESGSQSQSLYACALTFVVAWVTTLVYDYAQSK